MRKTIVLAALFIALLGQTAAIGDLTLQRGDRWPHTGARAVIRGGDGNIYLGRGNILTILNATLSHVGDTTLNGEIQGIGYDSQRICAAMGGEGLQIVDVSAPGSPSAYPITYQPATGVDGVFVTGHAAYTVGINRLAVADVGNPANPTESGSTILPGLLVYGTNLHVSGGIAAVADQVNGLHLVDVTAPQPDWLNVTPIAGAWDVAMIGDLALVTAAGGRLAIVDISNPHTPDPLDSFDVTDGRLRGMATAGDIAYVADETSGVHRIDFSDPNNPILVQTYTNTQGAYAVATDGGTIWVADLFQGLQRIGAGTYDTPADAQNLFVDEEYYLYAVDDHAGTDPTSEGLRILDVFHPGDFLFKGFVPTPGEARAVYVAGDDAYLADGSAGLQIIDVSGRTGGSIFTPSITGSLNTSGTALDVYVSGGYAYIADGTAGLRIVNVSDPSHPTEIGFVDTDGNATAVTVSGHYAYVADGSADLQIIDVTLAGNPVRSGFITLPGTAQDVAVSGDYAYVAAGTGGLRIVSIAMPAAPVIAGAFDTGGAATGVSLSGRYARVADGNAGLVTIDISDPTAPVRVDAWSIPTSGTALKTVSMGEYVFVAEDKGGAAAYRLSDDDPFTPTPYDPPGSGGSGCFIGSIRWPADLPGKMNHPQTDKLDANTREPALDRICSCD